MADDRRERYLAALEELLPMPPSQSAEVVEEINSHLDDAVADGIARGLTADRAETDAEARLGPPGLLARELARPEQSARRLLAAAGAGVRTGIGQWLYGYIVGWLLLFLAFVGAVGLGQLIGGLLGAGWSLQMADQGWNSLLTAGAIAVGLYFAGRAVPETVSITSRRTYPEVRAWVTAIVTTLLSAILVFVIEVPHNWASVVGWTAAPLAFALGAFRPRLLPRPAPGRSVLLIIGLLLLVPLIGLLGARSQGGTSEDPPTVIDGPLDHGLAMAGPVWTDEHPVGGTLFTTMPSLGDVGGSLRLEWRLADAVSLARLTDLRAEAWRADPNDIWRLDPRFDEPFAVAAVMRRGDTLTADLVTTNEPGVSSWELVLTGVGPDGRRYVLDSGTGGISTFTGTVWDWLVAVVPVR